MKKIFLMFALLMGISLTGFSANFLMNEPEAKQERVNDSTVIFYNVDQIEIRQNGTWLTCIIDLDTNRLVAKVEGSQVVMLNHRGTYMVMSKKQFTKTEV